MTTAKDSVFPAVNDSLNLKRNQRFPAQVFSKYFITLVQNSASSFKATNDLNKFTSIIGLSNMDFNLMNFPLNCQNQLQSYNLRIFDLIDLLINL